MLDKLIGIASSRLEESKGLVVINLECNGELLGTIMVTESFIKFKDYCWEGKDGRPTSAKVIKHIIERADTITFV